MAIKSVWKGLTKLPQVAITLTSTPNLIPKDNYVLFKADPYPKRITPIQEIPEIKITSGGPDGSNKTPNSIPPAKLI